MALNKQPAIATVPIMRMPEDSPNENISISKIPINPNNIPKHATAVSVFPTYERVLKIKDKDSFIIKTLKLI